jgi:hypothetical protein
VGCTVADERKFYAGDLGTQHLQHEIVVAVPEGHAPIEGKLIRVGHGIAAATQEPYTVLAIEGEGEYPWGPPERSWALNADWVVTVK